MSKVADDVVTKARSDIDPSTKAVDNSLGKKMGVSSFKINSVDQIVNIRRSDAAKPNNLHPLPTQATERTSSSSYRAPSSKKKVSSSSVEADRSTGTISTAIGYITSPARYIGSFFSSKKEPMVVKSAPALNKEKVKIISSSTDQVKDSIADLLVDNEKDSGDVIPPPTILNASTTPASSNPTKGKSDGKKSSTNTKRSISQNSKFAPKNKTSPVFQKEKKLASPTPVLTESKIITASNVKIAPSGNKISYKVTSKVKEEPQVKPKKDVRKHSLPRLSKNLSPTLTSALPTSKKGTNLVEKPDEASPNVLTCTPTSFVKDNPEKNATPGAPTTKYPSQLKIMLGGVKKYDDTDAPRVQQLANQRKCSPTSTRKPSPELDMSPTFLLPTCLESEKNTDHMRNIAITSLASNNITENSPSFLPVDAGSSPTESDNEDSPNPNKKFSSPPFPQPPANFRDSYVPFRRTSPQSRPDRRPTSPGLGPVSPSYNTNTNYQPVSPNDTIRSPDTRINGRNSIASSSQSSDLPAHASYRVISPERFPSNSRRDSPHKYRSVSRSPSRGRNDMSSYAERYNRQMNKSPSPNRAMHGRHMSKKDTFSSDNPSIIVMPSNKFRELAQERYEPPRQPERITATQNGSYKVSTKPIENTASKPNESAATAEDASPTLVKAQETDSTNSAVKELVSTQSFVEAAPTGNREQPKVKDPQQLLNVDTSQTKPPCKGIRLRSPDKVPPSTQSLYSSMTSGIKLVEENILGKVSRPSNRDVDHFNSLEQYGGNPAQHAAASTMLGEFP
ncbi:DNA-directed RNA polymerase II subunit RPB1 [Biomphalaria glabrata]|nr:DNA-directed RNA polymerase II subunit RPB1-like [Biomphalaria glabrata]KAI8764010.1 DNA-directed RNA polymerase II subunit RPB1 [Biomphalaria glabrata]